MKVERIRRVDYCRWIKIEKPSAKISLLVSENGKTTQVFERL